MDPVNLKRRKHPRFLLDLAAEYWPVNSSKSRLGRTGDISEGGVLLYLPEKIAVGQNIGMKIFIDTGFESKTIEAIGKAVWYDSHVGKKDYYHRSGVEFVDISAENMDELKNMLNAPMNSGAPSELNIPPGLLATSGIPVMDREGGQPIVDEPSQEEKWKPLQQREKETFSAAADGKEEEATKLPPELIYDFQEDFNDEQRQNLYRKILDMSIPERQRLAILANREARTLLIRDPNKLIALNVLKNAKVNESEVLQYAQRRDLAQDIILAIAQDQKWRKNYPIIFALVSNPKTPLSVSITFVSHLHERDLNLLSRDKNVSSVLRRKAEEILHKRNEK
jgi:hypothetical protein